MVQKTLGIRDTEHLRAAQRRSMDLNDDIRLIFHYTQISVNPYSYAIGDQDAFTFWLRTFLHRNLVRPIEYYGLHGVGRGDYSCGGGEASSDFTLRMQRKCGVFPRARQRQFP